MIRRSILSVVILATFATGCTKVYYDKSRDTSTTSANPAAPTPTPAPAVVADTIEYRVYGQVGLGLTTIKYTNSIDGLTVLSTASLPYVATVKSTDTSVFLYCEASSISVLPTAVLQSQIYVNGRLFRDAFASGLGTLSAVASGTYRR